MEETHRRAESLDRTAARLWTTNDVEDVWFRMTAV